MEVREVRGIVRDVLEDFIQFKECPTCKADTTMAKVEVWPTEGDSRDGWRCLSCLSFFEEKLIKLEHK